MRAGKELDENVARHVLELREEGGRWLEVGTEKEVALRPYSEDIAAAWILVDQICDRGYRLQLEGGRLWRARFYKSMAQTLETHAFSGSGGNPAEAICKAALALKGVMSS